MFLSVREDKMYSNRVFRLTNMKRKASHRKHSEVA